MQCWYPLTVASLSRAQKITLKTYMKHTADDEAMAGLGFKLHDFGFRGATCAEAAGIGGAAHLVNFMGSDTVAALTMARDTYGLDASSVAGFSIPASEHSTITSWGAGDELGAFENMLDKFPTGRSKSPSATENLLEGTRMGCSDPPDPHQCPLGVAACYLLVMLTAALLMTSSHSEGLVACVSDSFNIFDAIKSMWGGALKEKVKAREGKGTLVVRPDSGHPPEMVVKCLELLGAAFGTTTNAKGYKMLPSYVRLIQGDGIDIDMLANICGHMALFKWSVDNVAFGSGGGLLQKVNRDTQKCAYKCSWVEVDGVARDVQKNPITAPGKKSKKGRLTLEKSGNSFVTVENGDTAKDCLVKVFDNGDLVVDQNFAEIRVRADVRDDEVGELPEFSTSEEWVLGMDAWAAEYEVPGWESCAALFTPKATSGASMVADLKALEESVSASMSKTELAEALQALNRVNAKLLGVAEKYKKTSA